MAGEFEIKKQTLKRDSLPDEDQGAASAKQSSGRVPAQSKTGKENSPVADSEQDATGNRTPEDSGSRIASLFRRKKSLTIYATASACLLLIVLALFLTSGTIGEYISGPTPKLEPVTSITRPIPVPDYREMLDFILLGEGEGQKTLTAIRMEFEFHSPSRYQNFKDENVLFRETVYSFLQKQNASRNTTRSWHVAVERELLDFIRVKLPLSRADSIKLTQVENL